MIVTIKNSSDFPKLRKFLSAIVLNKAIFWSLHIKSNLDSLRQKGIAYWALSQKIPLSRKWAKRKAKLNGFQDEANMATGQTKEQALFATGLGEIYTNGKLITSSIIADDWVPNPLRGSPPWRGREENRPFYTVSMIRGRHFWRPQPDFDGYINLKTCDKEIWKFKTTEEVSVDKAGESLIFPMLPAEQVLKGKNHSLGSWKNNSNSGAAASWR
jgi:hypothetical protein